MATSELTDIIEKHKALMVGEDYSKRAKMIESFMIGYLNMANAIAYLFVREKLMPGENHREYFKFYIAYAKKLLDLKNSSIDDDQFKYWPYIKQCVEKYDMKSNKTIPGQIETYYLDLRKKLG